MRIKKKTVLRHHGLCDELDKRLPNDLQELEPKGRETVACRNERHSVNIFSPFWSCRFEILFADLIRIKLIEKEMGSLFTPSLSATWSLRFCERIQGQKVKRLPFQTGVYDYDELVIITMESFLGLRNAQFQKSLLPSKPAFWFRSFFHVSLYVLKVFLRPE